MAGAQHKVTFFVVITSKVTLSGISFLYRSYKQLAFPSRVTCIKVTLLGSISQRVNYRTSPRFGDINDMASLVLS